MFQQGKKFKNNQNKYNNLVKNKNLKQISSGKINIVNNLRYTNFTSIEGFEGEDRVEKINSEELDKLEILEKSFDDSMNQYMVKYKKYLEELQTRQVSEKSQYRNKVIKDVNGDKYYVNNIGMARQFTDSAWVNKDNSCSDPTTTVGAKEFSQISLGSSMGIGEKCTAGGYNAVDSSSGTTAWIDTLGYKHFYDDFRNKHSTCPSQIQKLTSIQFNAIPNGNSFGRDDPCSIISLDSPLYDQIMTLNGKLMRKVEEMKTEVDLLKNSDIALDKNIVIQKQKLMNVYNDLKKQKLKINKLKTRNKTMIGETDELILNSSAIQFHHLIWMVVGGTFLTSIIMYSK
tara:strand:- start:2184 stop:3212 length:1029 start_codon:yes stop_codon:yes gene_type:complete